MDRSFGARPKHARYNQRWQDEQLKATYPMN